MMVENLQTNQSRFWTPKHLGKIVLFGLVYFGFSRLGFLVPFSQGQIATLLWPGPAIALAILLLYDLNLWPGLTLGALLVAISNNHSTPLLLTIVVTHTLEGVSGAWIIYKLYDQFDRTLERLQDVRTFILVGAILGPAIGATLGALSFALSPEGANKSLLDLWWQWWAGHAMSNLIITPAILTWAAHVPVRRTRGQYLEIVLVYSTLILVGILVFTRLPFSARNLPLGHVVFPFLLWLALRFSPHEVAGVSLIISIIAIVGTAHGTGPFSRPLMATNLLLLLSFVIAVMLTTLIISSIMTERRQSQRELQERHDLLEVRVAERTAALSILNIQLYQEIDERKIIESELAQARDQALEALRLKSQILANVSHDARTPLNVITLYTQILQKGKSGSLSEKQLSMLDTILIAARELLHFINNLLDEAHLQSHNSAPKTAVIELQSWFAERINVLQPLAQRKGLELKIEIVADMPASIETDPEGLKQIFNNLVDNAIKFTTDGMIVIKVFKDNNEKDWAIQVKDSGCGIPVEAQESIFEAFWQVDGSETREVNRGVGLGLSIVKQRLALLGGSIRVKSEPNEGSVFTAVLPLSPISTPVSGQKTLS